MDDRNQPVSTEVGMGITVVGGAVRGPAGMADADATRRRLVAQMACEVVNTARFFAKVHPRTRKGRHAGAIVAAVFQPVQPFDEDRFRFPRAGVANDSTHAGSSHERRPVVACLSLAVYRSMLANNKTSSNRRYKPESRKRRVFPNLRLRFRLVFAPYKIGVTSRLRIAACDVDLDGCR